jgi:DNA processing protein
MPLPVREGSAKAWLLLLRAPQLGSVRIRNLISTFGSAESAISASAPELRRNGIPDVAIEFIEKAESAEWPRDRDWLQADDHWLVTCESDDFPELLQRTPQAPAALFIAGSPDLLWYPQIAIVGSRNPTEGGRDNARDFSRTLGRTGLAITSGLADGIDAAAHRAALEVGAPTIAVIGTGPDLVYPPKHRSLSQEIAQRGALVSEFPPGTEARRENFPRRNRIIAGLSLGTLVVEAALQSGALITARLAAEAGREVFALPGSIHNPLAKGCHRLIRDGAALVETTQEIIDALASQATQLAAALRGRLTPEATRAADAEPPGAVAQDDPHYQRLWLALDFAPAGIDALAERSGLTVEALSSMLLVMELDGRVSAAHGRYAKRRS